MKKRYIICLIVLIFLLSSCYIDKTDSDVIPVIASQSVNNSVTVTSTEIEIKKISESTGATEITPVITTPVVSQHVEIITKEQSTQKEPIATYDIDKLNKALEDTSKIDSEIEKTAENRNVTGMSIAVFANGEVIYTKSLGYADIENSIKTTDDTKYRAASVSKTAAAILAMTLWDKGVLNLDGSVSQITGVNIDNYPDNLISPRHLMTHTAGLHDFGGYDVAFYMDPFPALGDVEKYGEIHTKYQPGKEYVYSNFGMGIMAAVIESLSGQRFYNYAQENLFNKLNIDAGYMRTNIKDTESIAKIYQNGKLSEDIKTWRRTEDIYDMIPLGQQYMIAQAEMIISAKDMAKLGIILSGDGIVDGVQIISKEAVEELNKIYISIEEREVLTPNVTTTPDVTTAPTMTTTEKTKKTTAETTTEKTKKTTAETTTEKTKKTTAKTTTEKTKKTTAKTTTEKTKKTTAETTTEKTKKTAAKTTTEKTKTVTTAPKTTKPEITTQPVVYGDVIFTQGFGMGLRMNDYIVEGRTITGHPGQALGMAGGLYFDASDGTGVAILTNGCNIDMNEYGMYKINDDIVKIVYKTFFS